MKIVHLTSVHRPRDTRIFHRECTSCAEAGHETVLIAKSPNNESVNGIAIVALNKPANRFWRMFGTAIDLYRKAIRQRGDIYQIHDPELLPIGVLLRFHGKRVIYDAHEDVPRQILSKPWIKPGLRLVLSKWAAMCEWLVSRCFMSGVVTATPTIANRFPKQKTVTVQNFPNPSELVSDQPTSYLDRPPTVVYVGELAAIRGILECTRAMEYVQNEKCRLVIAGAFDAESERLKKECLELKGWLKVDYLGWQNRDQIKAILDRARIGLVVLHPTANYVDAWPVKMFEYMAAGIPVVASDFTLWRQIIDGSECGLLVDPMDPIAIGNAINWLLEHPDEARKMGENGQRTVAEEYYWDNEKRKLLDFYASLAR
jgi:glycosyltransferase involved in cell wall biosynthesis